MTILESLAGRLAALDTRAFSAADQEALQTHILDTAAATAAGFASPDGRAVLKLYGNPDRVQVQVAATRCTEIDDIHLPSGTTPGSIVVPTTLVMARTLEITDKDLLDSAIAAGYEAMTRLGAAIGGQAIGYKGVWATYFCAPFAGAAVTARLMKLDGPTTAHALATALAMSSGRAGPTKGRLPSRWLLAGEAAHIGCRAALAAAEGYTGDTSLLDGTFLKAAHGIDADTSPLLADGTAIGRVSIKPYCGAKQVLGAVCAFEEILARGVDAGDIDSVRVLVPTDFARMIDHGVEAGDRLSSITSAPYQLALAAYHRDGLFDVARETQHAGDEITAFMKKVRISGDDELDRHLPDHWPAAVEVKIGGRSETTLMLDAPGDPSRPYTFDQVGRKFHTLADHLVGADKVDAWIRSLDAPR